MARTELTLSAEATTELPAVRRITVSDLGDALRKGLDDFWAMPTHLFFLCLIYPAVGLLLGTFTFRLNAIPLFYPFVAGFALIGPFAAIGLYELSRRREQGLETSWRHAFDVLRSPSRWAIAELGLLLLVVFGVWIATAQAIYEANFGLEPIAADEFVHRVMTTPEGWRLIIAGNLVGFLFAVMAFMLSSVSFPLLLDRQVGMPIAILTSVRAFLRNPLTLALWGFFVGGTLAIAALPFLVGLAVAVPVIGHATWHLYRKLVVPAHEVAAHE